MNVNDENVIIVERRPVVAIVLDLFGAPERKVYAWRPTLRRLTLGGVPLISDAEARQAVMMRADTVTLERTDA